MEADAASSKQLFLLEDTNIPEFALWATPECEPTFLEVLASVWDKCLMMVPSELDSVELYARWAKGVYDLWNPDLAD
jgi:hypothetical protein